MESESNSDHETYQRSSSFTSKIDKNYHSYHSYSPLTGLSKRMEEESAEKEYAESHKRKNYCEICYSKVSRPFQHESLERLFRLIHCKGCGTSCHLICHGLETPLEEGIFELEGSKYFFCERCKEGQHDNELMCYICGNNDGFLRMTKDKRWIHTLCAITSPGVYFDDVMTMSADLYAFRKDTQKIPAKKKCEICKTKVETLPCSGSEKGKYCHLHCALSKASKSSDSNSLKVSFSLTQNRRARVGEFVSENKIAEDTEDMALSLKEALERVGVKSGLGVLMELKQRKNVKTSKGRKRVNREDPKVNRFIENVIEQAKLMNKAILDQDSDEEDAKYIGGKIVITQGKSLSKKLFKKSKKGYESEEEDKNDLQEFSDPDTVYLLQVLYKEIFSENILLEVYSEGKLPKLRSDLLDFPELKSLSFPELLFFVCVFQRRVQTACTNLCTDQSVAALIKSARMIPFTLVSQLKYLNQKHFSGIVTDILLDPYLERCKPESAYSSLSNSFSEEKMRKNKIALQNVQELKTLYLKESCGVITENYNLILKYSQQQQFLRELYRELGKQFNGSNTSKKEQKDAFGVILKGYEPWKQAVSKIPMSSLMTFYAKGNSVGLSMDFEEMRLLEQMTKKSAKPIKRERSFSEESERSEESSRSNSRTIGFRHETKEMYSKPLKKDSGTASLKEKRVEKEGQKRKGRPRKAETICEEIHNEYKIRLKQLNEKPTLQEAQRMLDGDQRNGRYRDLEDSISRAIEWREQFEYALESNPGKLGRLVDKIDDIGVKVPEMVEALEMKKEWDLWKNSLIDINKRLKKKAGDIYTEKDKMVTMDELREIIDGKRKVKQMGIDDGTLRDVERKLEYVYKIQDKLEDRERLKDFNQLKDIEIQIKSANVYIPQIEILREKLFINEQINKIIEEPCTIEELEKASYRITENLETANPDLVSKLTSKLLKGKKLHSEASNFLNIKRPYQLEELALMAFLMKEAEVNKLEGSEFQAIHRAVRDFLLFGKLYAILFSVERIDLEKLENGEYPHFEGKTFEKLTAKCLENLEKAVLTLSERKIKDIKEICREFRNAHKDNSSYMHTFFESVAKLLKEPPSNFELKRESIFDKEDSNSNFQKHSFMEEEFSRQSFSDFEDMKRIKQEETRKSPVKSIKKEEVGAILEKAEETGADYEKLVSELEEIQQRYSDNKTGVSEQAKWAIEAIKLKKEVDEEGKGVTFGKLEKVVQKLDLLGLPLKTGLGRLLNTWFKKAGNARREYFREYEEKKIKLKIKDSEGIEELVERNRRKPGYDDARGMLQTLKSVDAFVSLENEIETVQRDMETFEEWAFMVGEVVKKYSPILEKYIEVNGKYAENLEDSSSNVKDPKEEEAKEVVKGKGELIKKDVTWLKQELGNLSLRRRAEETSLRIFLWIYECVVFISGIESKRSFSDVEKMMKIGKRLEIEKDDRVDKLVRILKKEVDRAGEVRRVVERLKRNEAHVAPEEVKRMLGEIENCLILLDNEKEALNGYGKKPAVVVPKIEEAVKVEFGRDRTNLQEGEQAVGKSKMNEEHKTEPANNIFGKIEEMLQDSMEVSVHNISPARDQIPLEDAQNPPQEDYFGSLNNNHEEGDFDDADLIKELTTQKSVPEGPILKIYEGSLEDMDDKEYQKIGLYTCDSSDIVSTLPQIGEMKQTNLRIERKVPLNRFEAYLSFTFDHKDKRAEKVISGWIESSISIYQSRCDQIAKELLNGDMAAVCAYNESSRIFLLHKNQMRDDWKTKLDLKTKRIQKSSNPNLFFILVHKPYKLQGPVKCITPEIIPDIDEKEALNNGRTSKLNTNGLIAADTSSFLSYNDDEEGLNSSIEASPSREDDEQSQMEEEINKEGEQKLEEEQPGNGPANVNEEEEKTGEWGNANDNALADRSAEMDREQRLMFGDPEWSLNGKRSFEEMNNTGEKKESHKMKVECDVEEFSLDGSMAQKKVKVEQSEYQKLLQKLQQLDGEQIIQVAQGLNKTEREAVIQLLREIEMMKKNEGKIKEEPASSESLLQFVKKLSTNKQLNLFSPQRDNLSSQFSFGGFGYTSPSAGKYKGLIDESPSFGGRQTSGLLGGPNKNIIEESPSFGGKKISPVALLDNNQSEGKASQSVKSGKEESSTPVNNMQTDAIRAQYLAQLFSSTSEGKPSIAKSDSLTSSQDKKTLEVKDNGVRSAEGKIGKISEDRLNIKPSPASFIGGTTSVTPWKSPIDKVTSNDNEFSEHDQAILRHLRGSGQKSKASEESIGLIHYNSPQVIKEKVEGAGETDEGESASKGERNLDSLYNGEGTEEWQKVPFKSWQNMIGDLAMQAQPPSSGNQGTNKGAPNNKTPFN